MNIKIGCDPELFVKRNGEYVSAHDLIPGTKQNPFMVPHGAVQVDGLALEFNIFPADTADEFVTNIEVVLSVLRSMVPEEYEFALDPTAHFSEEHFATVPDIAKLLGCEPDFNAYTMGINPKPQGDRPMRTAGGHVHIGWGAGFSVTSPDHFALCGEIVRALDETLFEDSLSWDSDDQRREMYGAKGSFRPKHFGVEYRPLSNAWLRSEDTIRHVYQTSVLVAERVLSDRGILKAAA